MWTHKEQWLHNRSLLSELNPRYPDWAATVAFYAALHAVDTLLEQQRGAMPTNHKTRNAILQQTHTYQAIQKAFGSLYSLGRTSRYLLDHDQWITWPIVGTQVLRRLYDVERSVIKLAGLNPAEFPAIALRQR